MFAAVPFAKCYLVVPFSLPRTHDSDRAGRRREKKLRLAMLAVDSGLKPKEYPARPTGSASWAEGDMNILWQEAYIRAVRETDDSVTMGRIYEALAAIGQRRLTPVTNEDELVALIAAEAGLQSMITERTSKTV